LLLASLGPNSNAYAERFVLSINSECLDRIVPPGEGHLPRAIVDAVAGDGTAGFRDGVGASAQFFGQEGLAVSADGGAVYVVDGSLGDPGPYHRLRKVSIAPVASAP
jgi:hypothetical protein